MRASPQPSPMGEGENGILFIKLKKEMPLYL